MYKQFLTPGNFLLWLVSASDHRLLSRLLNHENPCCHCWIIMMNDQECQSINTVCFSLMLCRHQTQQNECAPSEDSDQPGHPPSLIRVFAARLKKAWVLNYPLSAQWRLWSDWADAQADLSLRWAHSHFVGFVMSRLIYFHFCRKLCLRRILIGKGIPSNRDLQFRQKYDRCHHGYISLQK